MKKTIYTNKRILGATLLIILWLWNVVNLEYSIHRDFGFLYGAYFYQIIIGILLIVFGIYYIFNEEFKRR